MITNDHDLTINFSLISRIWEFLSLVSEKSCNFAAQNLTAVKFTDIKEGDYEEVLRQGKGNGAVAGDAAAGIRGL